jgi:hypothetical protein
MSQAGVQQVASSYNRIHISVREGLLARPGRQVKDHGRVFACRFAVLPGKKIAFEHLDSCPCGSALDDRFDPRHFAGGTSKTDEVSKRVIQQPFYHARSNETRGARY